MRLQKIWKKKAALLLAAALMGSTIAAVTPSEAEAAKKVSLTPKNVSIKVGETNKLKLKNNKKKVKWSITSGKKCIKLKAKKKTGASVVGETAGKAKVQAKIGKKKYTCKIIVKDNKTNTPDNQQVNNNESGDVITLHYNDENADEVVKQIKGYSDKKYVHVIVDDSVTSIAEQAFYGCSSLISIEIPNSVTSIGWNVFENCSSLKSILWKGTTYTSVGDFWKAFNTITLHYNDENADEVAKQIKGYSDKRYVHVIVDDSVTSIAEQAFYGCSSLISIEIPNSVTSIMDYAFTDCSSLTSIEIPNSVTSIGRGVFESCRRLTSIEIPNSVTSIGELVFWKCSSLRSILWQNKTYNSEDEFKKAFNAKYSG